MDYSIFVSEFKSTKDKEAYAKKHIVKQYLPYIKKLSIARTIANQSTHIERDGKEEYKKDTPLQYFLTIMKLIEQYSDIEIDGMIITEAYDSLMESGSISALISCIPESEVTEFRTLVDMCISDIYDNERDITSYFETKFSALSITLETMLSSLSETISQLQGKDLDGIIKEFSTQGAEEEE